MSDLAIIIVSHNTRADLDCCLRSLADHPPAVSHEVLVVDNASRDGSADLVRERWPQVRLVESERNIGYARGNNLGIRATRSELVLLLNSDTVVPRGAIDRLVAELRDRPDVAAVGPRIVDGTQRAEWSFGTMIGPWAEFSRRVIGLLAGRGVRPVLAWIERQTRAAKMVDWVSGACLLVRREDAEAVGLLDERYFIYCEDVDFCAALRSRGRHVRFLPDAAIVHYRGRSVATAPAATGDAYRRSQLAFYAKHHPRWFPCLKAYLRLRGQLPPPTADR